MTGGPLAKVGTTVQGINLDISRSLNYGNNVTITFVVPDQSQPNGWRDLKTIVKGFDRVSGDERDSGESKTIVFAIADLDSDLTAIMRNEQLHLVVSLGMEDSIYTVDSAPQPAPNQAQIFEVTCSTRTLRNKYFRPRQ